MWTTTPAYHRLPSASVCLPAVGVSHKEPGRRVTEGRRATAGRQRQGRMLQDPDSQGKGGGAGELLESARDSFCYGAAE